MFLRYCISKRSFVPAWPVKRKRYRMACFRRRKGEGSICRNAPIRAFLEDEHVKENDRVEEDKDSER